MITPDIIFIIPYRNREQQLERWITHMTPILSGVRYEIYVIHQKDNRRFNRGAIKNIGFLQVKKMYPHDYKNITLVFNDVDTMTQKPRNFQTRRGFVKHMFGFKFAFGGVFSITAGDFEEIGGFPNLWSWGLEDNMIKERWIKRFTDKTIDWTEFYGLRGHTPEEVEQEYIFDRTGEKGREIEVQIGAYVQETRQRNEQERAFRRPLSESIASIRSWTAVQQPIQSILKTVEQPRVTVWDVTSFDVGTSDTVGLYEKRLNVSKIRRQKVLSMGQLMRYQAK